MVGQWEDVPSGGAAWMKGQVVTPMRTFGLRFDVNCSILFTELPLVARAAAARAAGFEVLQVRAERLRAEYYDIAAVAHFLRKVVWTVPGFTIEKFRPQLRAVHDEITATGRFVSYATRVLIEARTCR